MLVVSSLSGVGDGGSSGILALPVETDKIPCPANRGGIKDSPYGFVSPLTSLWFLGPNSPRLNSVEPTWEVESEIYSDEFFDGEISLKLS